MTVLAEPIECSLPTLASPPTKPVGFPSPDGQSIYLSRTDWADLANYVGSLVEWIEAAAPCISGGAK